MTPAGRSGHVPLLRRCLGTGTVWPDAGGSWLDPDEGRPALLLTAAQIGLSAPRYPLVLYRRSGWRAS